ncbi:hypothetical protein [Streptomyces sp. NPDC086787]|uniref:hypothetical protein n=1 Tax=Streptomyces sp. NPDC086787 TaxID=3365759 RepID=UPI003803E5D6
MSSDARQAPVPPRPTTPPPGQDASRTGGPATQDSPPRFPPLRPFRLPRPAPPPSASARLPDTPPRPGGSGAPGTREQVAEPTSGAASRVGTPTPTPSPRAAGDAPPRPTGAPAQQPAPRPTRAVPPRPAGTPVVAPARRAEGVDLPRPVDGIPPRPAAVPGPVPSSRAGGEAPPRAAGVPAQAASPRSAQVVPPRPAVPPVTTVAFPGAARDGAAVSPDPALSWSAVRPVVSYGEPEEADQRSPGVRVRARTLTAAACAVLGMGLIGGAVTGSWLVGDADDRQTVSGFAAAAGLWHSVPVDELFPPTVQGAGAGPGGADRTWTRIAVAPDGGCVNAFDPLLRKVLAPAGCRRLLRATYTDATQSYVTTVGLLFTRTDPAAMSALATRFKKEGLDRRTDLMPRPYAAEHTVAADFGNRQRASWTISVLTDAPVVAYAVSGWADGRTVDTPQPAADAIRSGATTAPAQAGLGQEAQGLADRVQRGLRKTVRPATEPPS